VAEQLRDFIAQMTATELVFSMQVPGLDPKLALKSLSVSETKCFRACAEKVVAGLPPPAAIPSRRESGAGLASKLSCCRTIVQKVISRGIRPRAGCRVR
jgi:hypothetical protein